LKRILKTMKRRGMHSTGSGQGQVAGSPEHVPSGCTKYQVPNDMVNCSSPKRQSYPCNELSWLEMGTFQATRVTGV
jgi:hypothetical protein